MASILEECGVTVAGSAFVIEKTFRSGRKRLEDAGYNVASLVAIESIENGLVLKSREHA